jgi:phosphoribosylamine--glycine ligase
MLVGRELSYLVSVRWEESFSVAVAQDHKRVFDSDRGPEHWRNGRILSPGLLDSGLADEIERRIVETTLIATEREGYPFRGVLYCGLMLTEDGPQALEYNVRFGIRRRSRYYGVSTSDFAETCFAVRAGGIGKRRPNLE